MNRALLFRDVRIATPPVGEGYRRGSDAGVVKELDGAELLVEGEQIVAVGHEIVAPPECDVVSGEGLALVPGFVDAHTHACWAGARLKEWELRLRGASYPEILAAGGGILSTVRAVRAASEVELATGLGTRLERALREGTTTMEVKSGYGLDTATELKMLRAIARAGEGWAGTVVPTACIGHAKDPERGDFVAYTLNETLPAITAEFPGVPVDAYCETGAWSLDETVRLFEAALAAGHPVRIHADQFNALGMVEEAVRLGARSVDHLEATGGASLRKLAGSKTAGVFLPISGFHLDGRYADARTFVDAGGAPVVATNWNPGSAPSPSIPLAMGLAVRQNGLTPAEALTAVTANAATLLDLHDRGRLAPGMRADLVLLEEGDWRELAHTVGGRVARGVWVGGKKVG